MMIPTRCLHCHERLAVGGIGADHRDGDRWLCPKAENGETLYEAQVADAVHAAVAEMQCPTCGGTRLPPSQAGAPRGTCHCPENLEPVPGSDGDRRLRARRGLPCMVPPKEGP